MVLTTSTRPSRRGRAITDWFLPIAARRSDITVDDADLAAIRLPLLDEPDEPASGRYRHQHTQQWSRRVAAADAVVVVLPEYNHGMPATFKNAIDYLSAEWAYKPVAFISYGNTSAGTRSLQMAKQVTSALKMVPVGAALSLRIADALPEGTVVSYPALVAGAESILDDLTRVSSTVRPLFARPTGSASDSAPTSLPTPLPLSDATITRATVADAAELLVLQRACWVQEAIDNSSLELPALTESLDDVATWLTNWRVWLVHRHGRLVGAVRARRVGTVWEIGRLMVAPDLAGRGLGRWLLTYAESAAPDDVETVGLFTGAKSLRNLALYQRAGYRPTRESDGAVRLVKELPAHGSVEHLVATAGEVHPWVGALGPNRERRGTRPGRSTGRSGQWADVWCANGSGPR
jgi:NAD(P)H-dependent FMN reductase/GNAT superfamily N-acetyltransferase